MKRVLLDGDQGIGSQFLFDKISKSGKKIGNQLFFCARSISKKKECVRGRKIAPPVC